MESINTLMHQLDELQQAWSNEGLIGQDRHGADYTAQAIGLAERILNTAMYYRNLLADTVQ